MTSLRITNVHLVDPEHQTVELGNLSIKNGRIAADDPTLPSFDGQGNISRQALSTSAQKFASRASGIKKVFAPQACPLPQAG